MTLVKDFQRNSRQCIDNLIQRLKRCEENSKGRGVTLYTWDEDEKKEVRYEEAFFYIRASTEYSNPQLTIEDLQGIIAAKLLEAYGKYLGEPPLSDLEERDYAEIIELMKKPVRGRVIPFLLNTDDIEADRYSINPLRESIISSGQSAYPVYYVQTRGLRIDKRFVSKYIGSLISKNEIELITTTLEKENFRYVDFVDILKYKQLALISEILNFNLSIPTIRMPLEVLAREEDRGVIHSIIRNSHQDYETIGRLYRVMGRNIVKRKTLLLTIPHSSKGFGSKRCAKGKMIFNGDKLTEVKVQYRTTPLYPNEIDNNDVSMAVAEDVVSVSGEELQGFRYSRTPSSPQFALYMLGSPEDAVIWHGIGVYAGKNIFNSYISIHSAVRRDASLQTLTEETTLTPYLPLQFNLVPERMWKHPEYGNIDSSIGCLKNPCELLYQGMYLKPLLLKRKNI